MFEGIIDETKLTSVEYNIAKKLGECWNDYLKLPEQHPCDRDEFMRAIHEAQRIVAIRGIRK